MNPFSRTERVGEEIRKVLSEVLLKKVSDPRLQMVIVTEVRMTADLKIARIFFSISGESKQRQEAMDGFNSASGFLKRVLARRLKLRYMPALQFYYDDSFDHGAKIERLLKTINESNHTSSDQL